MRIGAGEIGGPHLGCTTLECDGRAEEAVKKIGERVKSGNTAR